MEIVVLNMPADSFSIDFISFRAAIWLLSFVFFSSSTFFSISSNEYENVSHFIRSKKEKLVLNKIIREPIQFKLFPFVQKYFNFTVHLIRLHSIISNPYSNLKSKLMLMSLGIYLMDIYFGFWLCRMGSNAVSNAYFIFQTISYVSIQFFFYLDNVIQHFNQHNLKRSKKFQTTMKFYFWYFNFAHVKHPDENLSAQLTN